MSTGSTFNDLPEELLLKIFLLQPMYSLVLLRCVCKLWDQIISSDYVNEFHLAPERTSSNTNKYLLLEGSESTSLLDSEKHIYHDIPMKNYECYGICDGLLCLSSTKGFPKQHSTIILWNPIFRKILPPLKIKYSELSYVCFGHHDGDYKVIKVVVFPRTYNVCIYSLSTDSWKIREYDGAIYRNYNYKYYKLGSWSSLHCSKSRLVNGIAYFVDYSGKYDRAIKSLDLNREIFREIPAHHWYNSNFIMEEYKESLALVGMNTSYNFDKIERVAMLVLRERNNSFTWKVMKLYRNKATIGVELKPEGFINKDELVIRITHPNAIATYSYFLWNVRDELPRRLTTTTIFKSSCNPKSFITLGVDATSSFVELGKYIKPISPPTQHRTRKSVMKEVAST